MRATQNIRSVYNPWSNRPRQQVLEEAAYLRWVNRGRPIGSPWVDWFAAEAQVDRGRRAHDSRDSFVDERPSQQAIEEAAYFRWVNRGRPIGDPGPDWFAAEAELNRHRN